MAEIVYEHASPEEGDGRVSLAAWARSVDKSKQHISVLYSLWNRWGCQADRPPFEDAYRMAETGKDDPDEASTVKNKNRVASAFDQLSAEEKQELRRRSDDHQGERDRRGVPHAQRVRTYRPQIKYFRRN